MNYILVLLIFLLQSFQLFGQLKPTVEIEKEIQRIDLKLEKFRNQHQNGKLISIVGAGIVIVPTFATGEINNGVLIAGTIISLVGYIVSMNSYKYLRYDQPELVKVEDLKPSKKTKPKSWWTPR